MNVLIDYYILICIIEIFFCVQMGTEDIIFLVVFNYDVFLIITNTIRRVGERNRKTCQIKYHQPIKCAKRCLQA